MAALFVQVRASGRSPRAYLGAWMASKERLLRFEMRVLGFNTIMGDVSRCWQPPDKRAEPHGFQVQVLRPPPETAPP
jgi:hypothetical protein